MVYVLLIFDAYAYNIVQRLITPDGILSFGKSRQVILYIMHIWWVINTK